MRALVCREYGPPDALVIDEQADPVAKPGEVVIDVVAAGINFPDVLSIAGQYQVKTPPPFVPGSEAAGVISSIGDGAGRFAVGDKVVCMTEGGAFAEKCAVNELTVMPLPDGLDFEQGAGFTIAYGTTYHALVQSASIQAGETVLVLGAAGGVGVAAVEIAAALGARVIAAASSDDKLEFCREAGAHETINYNEVSLKDTVKELTDGKGVDIVYDPVGGDLATQAYRALAWHGRYLVIGFASGDIPNFAANIALLKEASINGVWWGTWALKNPKLQMKNMQEMAAMIAAGSLTPRCTESYALDAYADAFRAITDRRALGKVILRLT
jgi:NADPH2:quinone reductase